MDWKEARRLKKLGIPPTGTPHRRERHDSETMGFLLNSPDATEEDLRMFSTRGKLNSGYSPVGSTGIRQYRRRGE